MAPRPGTGRRGAAVRGPALPAVLLAAVLGLAGAACTRSEGGGGVVVSTSAADVAGPGRPSPELATETAADLTARLDEAEADRDPCALASVLEAGLPDFDDREAVVGLYRRLAEIVAAAEDWVPPELADDWEPITAVLADGAAAVEAADGDLTRPGVAAVFDGDDLQRAVITVARWSERSC